ncbi:RagB/SusD family nutrient uptake outer membrane protein [Saccharicrinis aurantiacus]|uniref:RagB/SusD family nutrient uptake outer membrane protein n=1 Tax=Saccharicrinis aurantiacus TaxID=1849719 RepID=UPI002492E0BB|nr:RagB/SusD family nutrient uptake outer membrane protein [Saccharicrinis aurantiacus]
MKILKYIVISLVVATSFSSCEDDLLTQVNPNAMTTDSFWNSRQDFDYALNALYSALQFSSISGRDNVMNMMKTDLAGAESWYGNDLQYSQYTWNDASPSVIAKWSELYIGVFRANQVLYYLEKVDFYTEDEKNVIAAQAKFVRGLNYFLLVANFNTAVVHDVMPLTDEELHKPLTEGSEVITNMVIPDFEFARTYLPKVWEDKKFTGKYTWGAATAMLGKTYLYQKDWANAAMYLKEVIDEKTVYGLVDNYMDNFTADNEFNKESILEISYSDQFKPGTPGGRVDDIHGTSGSEATSISSAFASITGAGGYNTCLPTYWLQELFVSGDSMDVTDARNEGKFVSSRTFGSIVVLNERGTENNWGEEGERYYNAPLLETDDEKSKANFSFGQGSKVKKWTGWNYLDAEDSDNDCRSGINFRMIRLADVYLMYAEAILEKDGANALDEAMFYVDELRRRAAVITLEKYKTMYGGQIPNLSVSRFANELSTYPLVAWNAANLLNHIKMVERPVELAFEGHRWFDLVRWGMVKNVLEARATEEAKIYNMLMVYDPDKDSWAIPATAPRQWPLYLNQRVREDFKVPVQNYSSANHDFFPIPAQERTSNRVID